MKYKRFSSFLKGIFKQEDVATRIADESLLRLRNMDPDISGRLERRLGYDHWSDLEDSNSITSSNSQPVVDSALTDFSNKVQGLYHFVDLAGVQYVFAVANKKVYAEVKDGPDKVWVLLNPTTTTELIETSRHIKMVSYLDTVFINDLEHNVYMYSSQQFGAGGWVISGNRFVFFAGATIFIRSYTDFSDLSEDIVIEDVAANLSGKAIYDSLIAINFDNEVTVPGQLNFGYCVRIGNATVGYTYFVLSNGKNEAANDECYIVKFNDRFIAQDYVALTMATAGEVISFGTYNDEIYIWCQDGRIEVLDTSLANTPITTGDIADMVAPVNVSSKSQYSLDVDSSGIYLYTEEIPSESDWRQPKFSVDYPEMNLNTKYVETTDLNNLDSAVPGTTGNLVDKAVHYDGHIWLHNTTLAASYITKLNEDDLTSDLELDISSIHTSSSRGGVAAGGVAWFATVRHLIAVDMDDGTWDSISILDYLPAPYNSTSFLTTNDALAYDGTNLWAFVQGRDPTYTANDKLFWLKIDPDTGTLLDRLEHEQSVSVNPNYISVEDSFMFYNDNLWVGGNIYRQSFGSATDAFIKISTVDGSIIGWADLGVTTAALWTMAGVDGLVFGTDVITDKVYKANASTLVVGTAIDLSASGENPVKCWARNDKLWVYCNSSDKLYRYNPSDNVELNSFSITQDVQSMIFKDVYHWVFGQTKIGFLIGPSHFLFDSTEDSTYFTSVTVSKYPILVGLDFSGNFLTREIGFFTWKFMLILNELLTDLANLAPVQIGDESIYYGAETDNASDDGIYVKLNLADFDTVEEANTLDSDSRLLIQGDSQDRFWLHKEIGGVDYYRSSTNWLWSSGINEQSDADVQNIPTYNSNLLFHILKQIQDISITEIDQIKPLGTPKTPPVTMDNDDLGTPSDLEKGTVLKYYTAFKFLDDSTTDLSPASEEITIPDLGADPQDVKLIISDLDLLSATGVQLYATSTISEIEVYRAQKDPNFQTVGSFDQSTDIVNLTGHGFSDDDVVQFVTDNALPAEISARTDYYVVSSAANTFQISTTQGGSALNFTDNGTGPNYVNKPSANAFTEPVFLAKMEKDDDDLWFYNPAVKPYAENVYEDNQQTLTYNPFTRGNIAEYPCKDLVVHKNRLVLVNKTNEINSNVLHYSDLDNAEALPPSNLRAIESGDGDSLVGGISVKDYLFLFKESRIYGILGDVPTGQLIDVSLKIGTPYARTITAYNDVVYFMNKAGIFQARGPHVEMVRTGSLEDLFDTNNDESIDFDNCIDNAFSYVDKDNQEILFYVPKKIAGAAQTTNNWTIVYDVQKNFFKERSYNDPIFHRIEAKDVISKDNIELKTDYSGLIYKVSSSLNDNGNAITYTIWTKAFNVDNDLLRKIYKVIKVFGENTDDFTVTLDIDGVETVAEMTHRDVGPQEESVGVILGPAFANRIIVKLTGGAVDQEAISIDEILLGFEFLRGFEK